MDCAQCGEANRDGARFCGECGAILARRCASCNAELNPKLKFCDGCGTPTSAAAPLVAPAASAPLPDATRKTVTALFADLVGSTSFGERSDAEVARSVMARYHALLQEAIDAHGGTVAKFMGDGMMATFGIPEIAEDDAIRAVRAGVDIQDRFTAFAADVLRQHGETLGLRVGVNTGEVVIASGDADLVGDGDVAARIEHACNPGRITVGEETWRLTRGEFGYESLGDVTVAGRAQPVAIFEVATDIAAAVETTAPFVGRAREMTALREAFASATTARAARLVTVLGSPGVGKTRLSRELCAATSAESDAITFEIRCDRAGDSTSRRHRLRARGSHGTGSRTARRRIPDRH
ncbi:MAG: zinc ribbon domain-containing protein [Acidimicrobiia bacterium]|nr:zinc ribbon domain-containing protein [Acidimicrobiia bacterium]